MKHVSLGKAFIITGLLSIGLLLFLYPLPSAQLDAAQSFLFSTGELSLAHQTGDGEQPACFDCHIFGQRVSNNSCNSCHDTAWFEKHGVRLAQSHRLFDRVDNCLRCHTEHRGKYAPITAAMGGKHLLLPEYLTDMCEQCHLREAYTAHPQMYYRQCRYCHVPNSWTSTFDHWRTEGLTTAPSSLAACTKCHPAGYHAGLVESGSFECGKCHLNGQKRY